MVHLIRGGEVGFANYVHRLVDVVGHADRSAPFKDYCLGELCTTPALRLCCAFTLCSSGLAYSTLRWKRLCTMFRCTKQRRHQTKKGNQWHHGMKAHIGTDAESGLVHTVVGTAANVHDVTQAHALLHGEETCGFGDAGYRGAEKREEVQKAHPDVEWFIAMRPGECKALDRSDPHDAVINQIEKIKAGVRASIRLGSSSGSSATLKHAIAA